MAVLVAAFVCGCATAATPPGSKRPPGGETVIMPSGKPFAFWDDRTEYAKVYHVAREHPRASDDNPGTADLPFATINRAAAVLQPGEKVIVHKGVYRECVRPARGGTAADRMIAYDAAPGEEVHVRGSDIWSAAFRPSEGYWIRQSRDATVWMGDLPSDAFQGYNPFLIPNIPKQFTHLDWTWTAEELRRLLLRRGAVYADGRPLRQAYTIHEVAREPGTFWIEPSGLRIHFRLAGDADPSKGLMEFTAREQVFAPAKAGLSYIRVSGFHFAHAADGLPSPQRAMFSVTRGDHWIVEDSALQYANACAIDIGRQEWSVVMAEPFGHHVIRRNRISDCGVCGIAGWRHVDGTLVEDNVIERIGGMNVERSLECAALKFHGAHDVLIRRNVFRHIHHAAGVWLDLDNRNCRITGNVFADVLTMLGAAYVECSHDRNAIDRNVFWNIRDGDPREEKPDYVMHGGLAVDGDSTENLIVAHNLFGRVTDNYAVGLHLQQGGRVVPSRGGPRTGLCRRCKVLNNVFYRCPRQILLARAADNVSEGNCFGPAGRGRRWHRMSGLCILNPPPKALLNLAAWRTYYKFDISATQSIMELRLDDEALVLTCQIEAPPPLRQGVEELGEARERRPPGPFTPGQWKKLQAGQTLTITLPAGAAR
jgi:hypothetical protein